MRGTGDRSSLQSTYLSFWETASGQLSAFHRSNIDHQTAHGHCVHCANSAFSRERLHLLNMSAWLDSITNAARQLSVSIGTPRRLLSVQVATICKYTGQIYFPQAYVKIFFLLLKFREIVEPDGTYSRLEILVRECQIYMVENVLSASVGQRQRARPGVGIMEADDLQVTTVFTVQPSFTIGTRQTEYHEALPSSANVQPHLTSSFADDGNAS